MQGRHSVVIGGGISGLLTAYLLQKKAHQVTILEKSPRVGGWIFSESKNGRVFEWGPHTLLADKRWLDIFSDLHLQPIFPKHSHSKRYIWKNAKRILAPSNPFQFLLGHFASSAGKRSLLSGLFKKAPDLRNDLTIEQFFSPLIGSEAYENLVEPFVRGIYAGDAKNISFKTVFHELAHNIQTHKSLFRAVMHSSRSKKRSVTFKGGLEDLVRALRANLKFSIQYSSHPNALIQKDGGWLIKTAHNEIHADEIFLSTPASETSELLKSHISSGATHFLQNIPYQRVALWQTIFNRPSNFRSGFGCLVPQTENLSIAGSLWSSEVFECRANPGELLATQFFAGNTIPSNPEVELGNLQKILGITEAPIYSEYKIFERAIPQFTLGHAEKVANALLELPRGVHIVSNYLQGPGLRDILKVAEATTCKVL